MVEAPTLSDAGDACYRRFRQRAQDVVEYGLMIASVVFVVLLGVAAFGNLIAPWFESVATRITTTGT